MEESDEQTGAGRRRHDGLFADADEIVAFAQAYYVTEFPDFVRQRCPTADSLRALARSDNLPEGDVRSHLFKCSQCFRIYRGARLSRRVSSVPREFWGAELLGTLRALVPRHAYTAAGAACLGVVLAAAAASWWRAPEGEAPLALNTPPEVVTPSAKWGKTEGVKGVVGPAVAERQVAPTTTRATANRQRRARPALPRSHGPALRVVDVNLQDEVLLRGGDDTGDKPRVIELSAERQKLRLRLLEGGGGEYDVSIVDAFGKPLIKTRVRSHGKTLVVNWDLRSLPAIRCRLCVARPGEAPDCYQARIRR